MKRLSRWLELLVVLVATVYFINFAVQHSEALLGVGRESQDYKVLVLATIVYCIVPLTGAGAWAIVMWGSGETRPLRTLVTIFLVSQFARYIPGNFMHYLSRVALARKYNVNVTRTVFTMVLETGITVLWGVVLAALVVLYYEGFTGGVPYSLDTVFKLGLFVVAALAFLGLGSVSIQHHRPSFLRGFIGDWAIRAPGLKALVASSLCYLMTFVFMGSIVYILLTGMQQVNEPPFWLITGIFAVAWVAGFVVPAAPAGLGVREAVLVALLDPLYGGDVVLVMAVALRLVTTVGDGLVFAAALVSQRFDARKIWAG